MSDANRMRIRNIFIIINHCNLSFESVNKRWERVAVAFGPVIGYWEKKLRKLTKYLLMM